MRQTAGLLLKNNVRAGYGGIDEGCRTFIRASLLPVLGHASRPLRHTAGTCAVTIVNLTGLGGWPELVAALAEGLDSAGDSNRVEGALDLVFKVRGGGECAGMLMSFFVSEGEGHLLRGGREACRLASTRHSLAAELQPATPCLPPHPPPPAQIAEDQPLQVDAQMPGSEQRAADVLVPRVLNLLSAPSADLRALAVATLNQLANVMPSALLDNMDRCVGAGRVRGHSLGCPSAWRPRCSGVPVSRRCHSST